LIELLTFLSKLNQLRQPFNHLTQSTQSIEISIFAPPIIPERMAKTDLFEAPDYFLVDELLTDEHKLIRASVRDWVKKEVSPIIEDYAQKRNFRNNY